jgi:hypothetical protein
MITELFGLFLRGMNALTDRLTDLLTDKSCRYTVKRYTFHKERMERQEERLDKQEEQEEEQEEEKEKLGREAPEGDTPEGGSSRTSKSVTLPKRFYFAFTRRRRIIR